MKAINDTIVNVATGFLVIIASSLICAPHPDNFHLEVPDDLRVIFLSITTIIALSNLSGLPKQLVQKHWEGEFGIFFFPFGGDNNVGTKRRIAGIMESIGVALTLTAYPTIRGFGHAILMVLYGRGAMVNARTCSYSKMVLAGGVSLTSGLLLKDEFYTIV